MVKIKRTIQISRNDFIQGLGRFVDTNQNFSSHPHRIQKPFFGEIKKESFRVKDTPNLLYRDSTILISGRFQTGEVEASMKPNNLLILFTLGILISGSTLFFFLRDSNGLGFIGIALILLFLIYLLIPYFINRNRFIRILNEIT